MTGRTITETSRLLASKALSPVELTRECLDRVAALNPQLDAFLLVTEDRAMSDARASEARLMRGEGRGPLDGIPIAHKDIYDTAGIRTTAHSRLLEHHVPERDATTVAKLAEAGTVMVGKLATHEFAMGGPSFDLPWPPARNPWNRAHFTGGSSSGTGAAVAAGLVLGGTGSDTGGSIRSPSALCGLAGIKPTYGLCSRAGIQPLSFSLDHAGPMAWTVADCAMLLQAMAGHDPLDPASADRPVPDFSARLGGGLKGLRVGVVRHFHEDDHRAADPVLAGIAAAAEVFAKLGAAVREVTLAPLADYQACGTLIMLTEAYAIHEPWLKTSFNDYGELLRDRLALGGFVRSVDYMQAQRRRREMIAQLASVMQEVDILLTASQPDEAAAITGMPKWGMFERPGYTMPFNVTGSPAMSVCAGFGPKGLPIAIQLVGRPFEEAVLLGAAHAFEEATPWRDRRPTLTPGAQSGAVASTAQFAAAK